MSASVNLIISGIFLLAILVLAATYWYKVGLGDTSKDQAAQRDIFDGMVLTGALLVMVGVFMLIRSKS